MDFFGTDHDLADIFTMDEMSVLLSIKDLQKTGAFILLWEINRIKRLIIGIRIQQNERNCKLLL